MQTTFAPITLLSHILFMNYTVLGATGFIGSHVAALARSLGHEVCCPGRDDNLDGQHLGHAIYSIGITADFRRRPHDTVTAHVTKLQEILTRTSFDSLVYLSSTRVYARCASPEESSDTWPGVSEATAIPVLPTDFSDLYNLSKLMGESIALMSSPRVKVARLSNVIGADYDSDNFILSVIRDGVRNGHVELKTSLDSAKDYVSVDDVASLLLQLGPTGKHSIYNVASGANTTHGEITRELTQLTGATVTVADASPTITFPRIDICRAATEFHFTPRRLEGLLPALVTGLRTHLQSQSST